MKIRFARAEDCPALLMIYAQYINTAVTFEYALPSEAEFLKRIMDFGGEYPYLVCEQGGEIIGYAYAHRVWEREAYCRNAELSVYIDESRRRMGFGALMYEKLIELLRLQGVKAVFGVVSLPNPGSEALHKKLGFSRCAVFEKVGFKCGEWHDVAWFRKELAPFDENPEPIIPITRVNSAAVSEILSKGAQKDMDLDKILMNFLDEKGRLTAFPVKRKMKLYSLMFFAKKFTPGSQYTESEVNDIICEFSTFNDPATIRRELCSYGFFRRTADCSVYIMEAEQPSPAALGL